MPHTGIHVVMEQRMHGGYACDAGDHDTVTASSDFGDAVMTGEEFRARVHAPDASLDQAAFNDLWPRLAVLARCSPQDKFTIIQGCQAYRLPGNRRDIVAMTGTPPLGPVPSARTLRTRVHPGGLAMYTSKHVKSLFL